MSLLEMMKPTEYHQITRTRDNTRLAVQVRGNGPALLLLAGQANSHHWWDRARGDFTDTHTTVTFDYRGVGDSQDGHTDYSTSLFADDALSVMDSLAIERFDVYGTSMGGRTAQWVATRAPKRVRHLVLGCTTPGGTHAVERSADLRRRLAGPEAGIVLLNLFYTPQWRRANPGPYATLGDPTISRWARQQHLKASNTHDAWDALPDITAPTLILHGSDDEFAPVVNAQLLADRIPGSTVHIFEGARHGYFDECRPEASEIVEKFLR